MRNIALADDASFQSSFHWNQADLPITLAWRSSRWRFAVPGLWIVGCLAWVWLVNMETPTNVAVVPYALLFIGLPALLATAAVWWVRQLMLRRTSGSVVVHDNGLEWRYEDDADMDLFGDCSRFILAGKRGQESAIEWEVGEDDVLPGWPRWVARLFGGSGRILLAKDVGLDHGDLDSLCKLLNQLREEAVAHR
jgi:hypothetical protein